MGGELKAYVETTYEWLSADPHYPPRPHPGLLFKRD